ncbi:BTAD domain-containing putative transcriptional regulator [Streptomyces sp. Ag109_G2-15]|uniref:BTAD domain-containing putative transcriptional regulator n=1 Tax=Streptomyces sp. Ag109_G2-15 TaxID=1938850 RepID=UPI000BD4519D|nr:BTAD domain-containing putative transcriptional regulator [Streptomyces sp. Ag109_G2-15]SOE07398.1 DNA-binding transcriptional activator of the SARP family [Streptomyces sp. Ag109_G2-15]
MEFRLLGPLEVEGPSGLVALGGTRQRAALAYLLLHAGEVVPTRRLLSAVWPAERVPGTARKILQNAIWRLRRTLAVPGEAQAAQLVTQAPGYVVRVPPERIDLLRFERLAAQGRAALLTGEPARARGALREALALWRGPALADLAEAGTVWPELAGLEQKRLDVMEDCFEVELLCGQHQSVLRDLDAFVRAEPLRERASGQLMLALYRSGRQADALHVYARIRTALVEGLGLEPGREMQRLQSAILAQDPQLNLPGPPYGTGPDSPPAPAFGTGPASLPYGAGPGTAPAPAPVSGDGLAPAPGTGWASGVDAGPGWAQGTGTDWARGTGPASAQGTRPGWTQDTGPASTQGTEPASVRSPVPVTEPNAGPAVGPGPAFLPGRGADPAPDTEAARTPGTGAAADLGAGATPWPDYGTTPAPDTGATPGPDTGPALGPRTGPAPSPPTAPRTASGPLHDAAPASGPGAAPPPAAGTAVSPAGDPSRTGTGTSPDTPAPAFTPSPSPDGRGGAYRSGSVLMIRFGLGTEFDDLPAGDIDRVLDTVCELAREEIEKSGGCAAWSIGSVLLSLFEEEPGRDGCAERAVRAALAVRDCLSIPASPLAPPTSVIKGLSVHAAVTTGTAYVCRWPSSGAAGDDPWISGELVDTCEAMLCLTPPAEIHVCDETRSRTEGAVSYHRLSAATATWQVRALRPGAEGDGPCYERDSELDLMTGFLSRARQRSTPHLISVLGHSDLGRTRLLMEFHRRIAETAPDPVRVLNGTVTAGGDVLAVPAEMLAACCGITRQDDPATADRKLASALRGLADAGTAAELLPALRSLLAGRHRGADERDRLLAAWRRFMAPTARRGPLVLIWDGLHQADDALLDAVEQLCADCPDAPLLVVVGAHDDLLGARPAWSGVAQQAMTLRLAPLAEDALDRLLRSVFLSEADGDAA